MRRGSRTPAPALRITCCLCGKPIPKTADIVALDDEWRRRFPQMVGILARNDCVFGIKNGSCRTLGGAFVPGHILAPGKTEDQDYDLWDHLQGFGTQTAMAYSYPWSAVRQGAEEWLRHVVRRPQLNSGVRTELQDALDRWKASQQGA